MQIKILIILIFCWPLTTFSYVNVNIDKNTGAVTANGEFFFPKIIWQCKTMEDMHEVVSHGFNVSLNMWSGFSGNVNNTLSFLDNCENAGLYGIPGIGRDVVRDLNKLSNYITGIKDHNALFAISFPDEGTTTFDDLGAGNTKAEMVAAYNKIKEITPNLIVIFDHWTEDNGVTWADIGDCCDAVGIDFYPFVSNPDWNSFHSWQKFMKILQTQTLLGSNCKAIWQFAQGGGPPSTGSNQKNPTYEDMALQFWASVVYYAKGAFEIYGWDLTSGLKSDINIRNAAYKLISVDIDPNRVWLSRSVIDSNSIQLNAQMNSSLLSGDDPYVANIALNYENQNLYIVLVNGHHSVPCGSISLETNNIPDQEVKVIRKSMGDEFYSLNNDLMEIGDIEPFGFRVLKLNLAIPNFAIKQTGNILIDANLNEFDEANCVSLIDHSLRMGNKDNSALFSALWDNNFLYIGLEVFDTELNAIANENDNNSELWKDDCIEIFIDPENDRGHEMGFSDYRYTINLKEKILDGNGFTGWDWDGNLQTKVNLNGTINDNSDIDIGYMIEVAIPWSDLNILPNINKLIGMQIGIADRDHENQYEFFGWKIDSMSFNNVSEWATIVLTDTANQPKAKIDLGGQYFSTGEHTIKLITTKTVVKIPTPLLFKCSDGSTQTITLDGSIPGNAFTGILNIDNDISEGIANFHLHYNALEDNNGNLGNTILSGRTIYIDKTKPSKPTGLKCILTQ